MRAGELVDRALGQAEQPDLAFGDEGREGPEALLDRHLRIDAVQVVEVQHIDPETRERVLAVAAQGLRAAVAHAVLEAALRRDHDLCRTVAQRTADECLVVAPAVLHRRVEVRHAQLQGAPEGALGDRVVLRIEEVAPRSAHAAEADGGNARAVGADAALRQIRHRRTLGGQA